ncbi:PIN domain-containing protein, partial [Vibrio anguillarum]|uniref:PIN domain-containing protein n=1 Tax=Vibrio anguillarum TaxID=55601 RepID=UPI00399D6FE4
MLRDNYMSMGVSEEGMYRITSEDIQRDCLDLIQGIKTLLECAQVEVLKPADTPELLVKMRDMVDDTVYSTFQLSAANDIPLLCIDHLMIELAHRSGCPAANMNSFVERALNSLSFKERKKSIQYNLFSGTPVSILY